MEILKIAAWFARGLVSLFMVMTVGSETHNLAAAQPMSASIGQTGSSALIISRPVTTNNQSCPSSTQEVTLAYIPNLPIKSQSGQEQLKLFGTIYAADYFSPLPDVRVELWRLNPKGDEAPFSPFLWEQTVTDSAGRYEFNLLESSQFIPIYVHYRLSYRGQCLLLMHLRLARHHTAYHRSVNGPLLRGPVDITLSVEPPLQ